MLPQAATAAVTIIFFMVLLQVWIVVGDAVYGPHARALSRTRCGPRAGTVVWSGGAPRRGGKRYGRAG
jgi:hypothetical protein